MTDHKTVSVLSGISSAMKPTPSANVDTNPTTDNDEKSSNKKTKTGNENVVLLSLSSFFSAEESAFSIDHILEFILAELNRDTLLSCRLVSRRWVHFSSKCLQKIVTFKFENAPKDEVFYCNGHRRRPFKDLVTLMNDSADGNFPCTSFAFRNNYFGKLDSLAQPFFSAHGRFITKLEFKLNNLLVSQFRRLLLTQAPNLKELICSFVKWKYTESETRSNKSETEEEERGRRESLFSETTVGPKPVFKNLSKFICRSKIPHVFLQQLLQCSPNLREVFLWPQYLPHIVLPVNRLHLLKHLYVELESGYMNELAVVANNHGGNWAVEEIDLGTHYNNWGPALVAQANEVVRKFLEECAATCQKLEWDDALEDFQFPVMPGVKHFRLCYSETVWTEEVVSNFPDIEKLAHTFPNLKSLEVKTDLDRNYYLAMENVFGNYVPAPVPNPVTKVSFKFHPHPRLLESFRSMFPNAVITD